MNLTATFQAKRDRHAKTQGDFTTETPLYLGDAESVWTFVRQLGSKMFRVVYVCKDGTARDIMGRQGVHNSAQDGEVQGIGSAMASEERLSLSFWTNAYGGKVNTGAGKGYRTLLATGILAIRCDGIDYVTSALLDSLKNG